MSPVLFSAFSPLYSTLGFRYLFMIYIDGVLIHTAALPPSPTDGSAIYDAAPVLRSCFRQWFAPSPVPVLLAQHSSAPFLAYDLTIATYAPSLNAGLPATLSTSPGLVATHAWQELPTASTSPGVYWLTSRPGPVVSAPDAPVLVPLRHAGPGPLLISLSVLTNGGYQPLAPYSLPTSGLGALLQFDFGLPALRSVWPSLSEATPQVLVEMTSAPGTANEVVLPPLTIQYRDSSHPRSTLVFLNAFGGYESFCFLQASRRALSIAPLAGQAELRPGFRLSSSRLSPALHAWFAQLLASPDVYIYHDRAYQRVEIEQPSWVEYLPGLDKPAAPEVIVRLARSVYTQLVSPA